MGDVDGPMVARSVYEELFYDITGELQPRSIAYALDSAVSKLRDGGLHPSRWAPYVHLGI